MIICAAIKIRYNEPPHSIKPKELIVCGHRHYNCFEIMSHINLGVPSYTYTQGFINHNGEFLDRKEAFAHALECGQLSATHRYYQEDHNIDELYSEDLY